eukprot:scaffold114103_cov29-Tisochrysis_lutea.AAC.2
MRPTRAESAQRRQACPTSRLIQAADDVPERLCPVPVGHDAPLPLPATTQRVGRGGIVGRQREQVL